MPSILVEFDGQTVHKRKLRGILRSLAWDGNGQCLLVGNNGRILIVQTGKPIALEVGTQKNLRAVTINPSDGTALIAGTEGSLLFVDEERHVSKVDASTSENLRAVVWNAEGSMALIAGNHGVLTRYSNHEVRSIEGGRANLRHVAWHPKGNKH